MRKLILTFLLLMVVGCPRCPRPGHYVRVAVSHNGLGDELRDEDGVAWGRLRGNRHDHGNASWGGRVSG